MGFAGAVAWFFVLLLLILVSILAMIKFALLGFVGMLVLISGGMLLLSAWDERRSPRTIQAAIASGGESRGIAVMRNGRVLALELVGLLLGLGVFFAALKLIARLGGQ
jgi:hypothetical protein